MYFKYSNTVSVIYLKKCHFNNCEKHMMSIMISYSLSEYSSVRVLLKYTLKEFKITVGCFEC